MSMLAELVDVVIGVDTHTDTPTATPSWWSWPSGTPGFAAGRSRTPAATALVWPGGTWPSAVSWSSSWTGLPASPAWLAGAKSDPLDVVRATLARTRLAQLRTGPEHAALSILLIARRAAVEAATAGVHQIHALVMRAPEAVRARCQGKDTTAMLATAARLRPGAHAGDVHVFTALTVLHATPDGSGHCATRSSGTSARSVRSSPPGVRTCSRCPASARSWPPRYWPPGRIPDAAASEAAFAMLAGVAPIPASSGRTVRRWLNRSGDRQLNCALHTVALCRLHYDPRTRAYADRRRAKGRTDREIKRCLKRYIARQPYRQLESPPQALDAS
ncbi:transposase [Actinosynnema sp. NPDC053489]|uniref:transposase n=1 Tax=Actinosynnema sp. NPDC053489 TaxID=3363916 RepID=UPI0037C8CC32